MTDVADWFAEQDKAAAARAVLPLTLDARSPDELAKQADVAKKLGIPPIVVGSDPAAYTARAEQQSLVDAVAGAPKTAAWLSNRDNGGVAKDDVQNLSWFEKGLKDLPENSIGSILGYGVLNTGRAVERGTLSSVASLKGQGAVQSGIQAGDIGLTKEQMVAKEIAALGPNPLPEMVAAAQNAALIKYDAVSGMTPEEQATMIKGAATQFQAARDALNAAQAIPKSEAATRFQNGPWGAALSRDGATVGESANPPDASLMGGIKAIVADPAGAMAWFSEVAAESVPAMAPAAVAAMATGSPVAGAMTLGATSGALESSSQTMDFLTQNGIKLDTPEDVAALMKNQPLLEKARQQGLAKGLVVGMFDAMSGGIAGKALAKSHIGNAILQSITQAAFGAGGEAASEAAIGQKMDWRQIITEGLAEFVTAPVEMVSVGRGWLKERAKASAQAGTTAGVLDGIDATVAASKLKVRSPEKFQNALESIMDGKTLYVPAEELQTLFQAKDTGFDPAEWGIDPADFAEQIAAGGKVAIPASTYAARISGTPDAEWFKSNATTVPGEMSIAETDRFNAEVQTLMESQLRAADQRRLADLESRASDVQVHDEVYSQLRAAGQTKDVATANTSVLAAAVRTLASRTGQDALDMLKRFNLAIQGPQSEPMRRRGNLDIALNTLRSGKLPKATGPTLTEFVRSQGGMQDTGGDLAAMDAPKGVIAESRDQIAARLAQPTLGGMPAKGKGQGIDQMARAAQEAGYFPGVPEADLINALTDGLRKEMAGNPVHVPGQEPDPAMTALAAELSRRGIDLATATNDQVAAALDQANPNTLNQENRASITFPSGGLENGTSVIKLFENSDLSSFSHEVGHYLLEVFNALASEPNAAPDVQADMQAIRGYLGMQPGDKPTVAQHEVWARSWEAYLMEGKAPSLGLLDAFSRFKAWLVRIYQTAKGLNVKVTPEIRNVMDRILASNDEIAAVRAEQSMQPLFTDEAAAGMSPEAFKTYQRMARRATEQAEATLLAKTMDAVRRKTEAWWKAEYKGVMGEVTKTINSQREYRLTEMLANQRWLDDTAREVPNIQIDRKQLVDAFGAGILAELSRERLGGKRAIYGDNGASLMEVADLFGFAHPQEMVTALQNAGKRLDAIRAETDRIMRDRYGDPLTDGSIENEALAAIHSDQQAMTVASEVRHLAARSGLPTRNLTAQVFRQRARLMLGRMSVGEAAKPDAFLAAGRAAARRAEDAFARVAAGKDSKDALIAAKGHKEQQLLNHYLYLESRDLAKEVSAGREQMRAYDKASVRGKLEGGYIEQIDSLLEQYDFRQRSKGQIARAESLAAYVKRMTDDGRAGELAIDPRMIERAQQIHYTRLSVDELRGLFDTIANIDHMGRFKQKLITAKKARELRASVDTVATAISKVYGTGKNASKNYVRNIFNRLWTTDTMTVEMDGMNEMGPVYDELKRDIDGGEAKNQQMQVELAHKVDGLFAAYSAKEISAMQKAVMVAGANGRLWSKTEILSVAMNMGNENNLQRLYDQNVHAENRLTPDQAAALVNTLDARDWAFVKGYADLINSYWGEIQAVAERRTGVKPVKVDAKPFETPHGTMPGWYYPIKYDPSLSARAARDENTAWDSFQSTGWGARTEVNSGMTKARAATGGGRALDFDLSQGIAHMKKSIRLIAMSEAVDNTFRILNHPDTVQAMQDAGRQGDLEVWNGWLKDVAQGPVNHSDTFSVMARVLKNNFTLSRLAFNLKTAVMQSTGLFQTAAVVGSKNVILASQDYLRRPRELVAEVIAKSAFMAERQSSMNKDINDYANDIRNSSPMASRYGKFKDGVGRWGFAPIQMAQFYSVDVPTWLAGYRAGLEKFKDEGRAMEFADRIVARSQGSGLMADRTAFERGSLNRGMQQSEMVKLFSTLSGYMVTKMNRGYITARRGITQMSEAETKTEAVIAATHMATDLMLIYVMEGVAWAGVYTLVNAAGGGSDDDKNRKSAVAFIASQTASAVVGGIPFGRDAIGAFSGQDSGGVVGSTLALPANLYVQMTQGENDRALRRSVGDLLGTVTGIPSTATLRTYESLLGGKSPSLAEAVIGHNPILH